jgi:hypothetical protein
MAKPPGGNAGMQIVDSGIQLSRGQRQHAPQRLPARNSRVAYQGGINAASAVNSSQRKFQVIA